MDMIQFLQSWLGTPYHWGGSSYFGTDCSGLTWKFLRAYGAYKGEKLSAQGFFDMFSKDGKWNDYRAGSLAFFGKDAKSIDHVAVLVSSTQMVEARGGDHLTLSDGDARGKEALVEMTYLDHRSDLVAIVRPRFPFEI